MSLKPRPFRPSRSLLPTILLFFASALVCFASQAVSVRWTANPETDISHYRILYGTSAANLDQSVNAGNATSTVIGGLADDTTYHFALRAVNTAAMESDLSTVVSHKTAAVAVPAPELAVRMSDDTELSNGSAALAFASTQTGSSNALTLTLANTGDAVLSGVAAGVSGTHAGDFAITQAPAASVAAGSQTSLTVLFSPTAAGTRTATLQVASNDADENPFVITLSGSATAPPTPQPEIVVQTADGSSLVSGSASLGFGPMVQGSGSAAITLTVRNTGTAALTGISAAVSGSHGADFPLQSQPPASIAAGGSATFSLLFRPSATGARSATLTITSNDSDEGTFTVQLGGTGLSVPAPEIVVEQDGSNLVDGVASLGFGAVLPGSGSSTKTLTIRNTGSASLTGIAVSPGGTHPGDFQVSSPAPTLAAGASTTFTVRFQPSAIGGRTATLQIASNDADENPFDITLGGVGLSQPEIEVAAPDGRVLASGNAALPFGETPAKTGEKRISITVRNTGTAALGGLGAAVSGTGASQFSIEEQPPASLAAGAETTIPLVFRPLSGGSHAASLVITSNDADEGSFAIALTGTGTLVPQITVFRLFSGAPAAAPGTSLGEVDLGASSPGVTYVIYNAGTAPLADLALDFAGSHPGDFQTTTLASPLLNPGESVDFTLRFVPQALGTRSARLQVFSNDPFQNPVELPITGVGIGTPDIQVTMAGGTPLPAGQPVDFGTSRTGGDGNIRSFTIRNTGNGVLGGLQAVRAGTAAADFTLLDDLPDSLPPGGTRQIRVRFAPKAAGSRVAQLRIFSDDPDQELVSIQLAGSALAAPAIKVSSSGTTMVDDNSYVTFGSTQIRKKGKTRRIVITNTGTAPLKNLSVRKNWLNPNDFKIGKLKSKTLAPGKSLTLKVTFQPKGKGNRWAALRIKSNDPDTRSFDIVLNGVGKKKKSGNTKKKSSARTPTTKAGKSGVTRMVVHIDGERYRALKIRKSGNPDVRSRDIQVSADLLEWKSGARHTTVVKDNDDVLIVRDNTPLGGGKRFIRLNPRR